MTFEQFKNWAEEEVTRNEKSMSYSLENENYGNVLFWQGHLRAMREVVSKTKYVEFEREEVQNKIHNDFSWENVKIGDKCVNGEYTGTVSRLIFDGDGYCCGMTVDFSDESGDKWTTVYQDSEYNCCEQIGGWINDT